RPKLKQFFNATTMSKKKKKNYLISISPSVEKIFEVWQNSVFNKLELSSVGIAIAHANYRRKIGETMDLSNWIK
ncbi:MAG: LPO_1073/Vpar_1526 family protein, partial [Saprospiraceae bacterium]